MQKSLAEGDNAKEEAQALLAEKEESKKEQGEKNDSAEIDRRVKERISLLKVAEKTLSMEDLERVDSFSDFEIKKLVITSKSKNAKLDDKSDVYINARYDAIIEDMPKNQVIVRSTKQEKNADSNDNSADAARERMIGNMKNAHKLGVK